MEPVYPVQGLTAASQSRAEARVPLPQSQDRLLRHSRQSQSQTALELVWVRAQESPLKWQTARELSEFLTKQQEQLWQPTNRERQAA